MSTREGVRRLRARALQVRTARARRGSFAAPINSVPAALLELQHSGPAALAEIAVRDDARLRIATLIPSFRRGSGGHATIVNLMRELQRLGHTVTLWLEDCEARHGLERASKTRRSFEEFFAADTLTLEPDFTDWRGADVVLATGWQTVARAQLLEGVGARAYLVQDHEPDFYPASAEALWATQTYRLGLHCIAASEWLAELLRARYGASTSHFDLAVEHATYRPGRTQRQDELVVFYARAATPRRAVPLGLLALEQLARRRPQVEIALYGEEPTPGARFRHRRLGVLGPRQLADLYRQATVGLVLSLTNPSLISLEMMACGLPCVELASEAMRMSFPSDSPLTLAEPHPRSIADAVVRLLDDASLHAKHAEEGPSFVRERTWERAAAQVESGLREALAQRSRSRSA